MAALFIPVGIPGCGKTYFFKHVFGYHVVMHSTDDIRDEVHSGMQYDPAYNDRVFKTFHYRIEKSLENGQDTVADATNMTASARETLRNLGPSSTTTHLFVFTNLKEAIARNDARERTVPPEAMVRMLEKYEQTLREIPTEEYDTVTYIEGTS